MAVSEPFGWQGLRVIELADEDGQVCGKLFADAGADVIKIESPAGRPPGHRHVAGDDPDPNRGQSFWHYTRRKRSLSLNLATFRGRDVFRQLIATADVLIESFPPGYLGALGCAFTDLLATNPSLIFISITPFGQNGPETDDLPADPIGRALGGYSELESGPRDRRTRLRGHDPDAWERAGRWAYLAVCAALRRRAYTGRGAYLDISVREALVAGDASPAPHDEAGLACEAFDAVGPAGRPGWLFPCRDGQQVFAPLVPISVGTWRRFVDWLNAHALDVPLAGEQYRHLNAIKPNLGLIYRLLQQLSRQHDAADVLAGAWSVGLPWELYMAGETAREVPDQPMTPVGWLPRSSLVVGHPPLWPASGPIPVRGQHTAQILVDELGYSPEFLKDLAADSVI